MKGLSLETLTKICNARYFGPEELKEKEIDFITIDSRKAGEGALFIPIVGERVDPHRFIPDVMNQGALASLSERELKDFQGPYLLVESTRQAVKDIAEFYLKSLGIPVVGITGSVGKTSTKEVIAAVLSEKYCTLKTEGNFNNELGLPLTVFRLREEHEIAVLEMGINHFGEMTRLARIARPDTCVITNIGTCHLEYLGDRDGVLRAKTEVLPYVKENGHIVLNGDDDKLITVQETHGIRPVFFGMDEKREIYADHIVNLGLKEGTSCVLHLGAEAVSVRIPIPGRHMVYNALAAAAVGRIYGLTMEQIKKGIEKLESISGRFRLVETEKLLIVDDCYNANPASMKASLDVLQDARGRRVAILGDMGELGEDEVILHEEVGAHAAHCSLEKLICVGPLSAHMARKAREENPELEVVHRNDREELLEVLGKEVQPKDTVLVKASHYMGFEYVVEALKVL